MARGTIAWWGWVLMVLVPGGNFSLRAQDHVPKEDIVARYEQILERAPMEGPSFDQLLQLYQQSAGLEALDMRWAPVASEPGPKGATYTLLRGLLADHLGKTDEARHDLQAAAQARPEDFYGWLALGDFEVSQGKWSEAVTALQKGLATTVSGDDRLSFYRKLGQAQERNLDLPAALATWQKMEEEFPKDPFALEEAGTAELDSDQFDEARKTFQKLVDLTEPDSMTRVQALMHLAEVDDRQGRTEAAVHDYEAILPLTAESSWLNRELRAQIEQIYRREDDLAGLVGYYRKWTQDNPKDVAALLLLSGALHELGRKAEALDVLRQVTVLAPDRHEVRESFAQALVEAKQYDEAITVLTALTADDPTEPRYWETMGDALWEKTQPPTPASTQATFAAWAHIAPPGSKDVAAVLQVAELCRQHDLNDDAFAGYQRALALSPDAADIREKAVRLLVQLKRENEAWPLLDGMAEGPLATAENELKLAVLDRQFDRTAEAATAIQKGLTLEPNNFDLLSEKWNQLAAEQKWADCVALYGQLVAAAPNAYSVDQLESRQLQALTAAGMLDETGRNLRAKLDATPALTESELRLLLRLLIQQSDPAISQAFDEAHRRFPESTSLIRIEIDYNRHVGNDEAAVAALQKLIETVPQQKTDWLNEIVHIRQSEGNFNGALMTAQQIIDASPASAAGYLSYAEIALAAGKSDAAVAKLQAAIKLSDKPNDVRQRLAHYYLAAGQAAMARKIYDDAFAAADNPQDKLAIVRAMTEAYFQDGQVDVLINRFKKEQESEDTGWRYGLYLSAIYEQMQDYGDARRELAKSLAVRPRDTALLRSLVGLAEKEGDAGELLHYRELLADADPSAPNEIALADEDAIQDKAEVAWRIVQKNQDNVARDPLAWKDVLNQVDDPDYAAKIRDVLEQAIRAKGDSVEGKFTLAQFEMQQGDLDSAQKMLWDILAQPIPAATASAISAPKSAPGQAIVSAYGFYQTPMFQRVAQSSLALSEAEQLAQSAPGTNPARQAALMRMYSRMGLSSTLDPTAIRDHALVYLAFLAVRQKRSDDFLKELSATFAKEDWPLSERLVAYGLIQAREPMLQAIEEEVQSTAPDKNLDQFGFMAAGPFAGDSTDVPLQKRAQAAQAILGARLAADPHFAGMMALLQINKLAADVTPAGVAKRTAAVEDYLKTIDRKNPEQLIAAIGLSSQIGNWAEIKKDVDDLTATDLRSLSAGVMQQLAYLPMGILQQATTTKEVMPKEVIPVVLQLLRDAYPATPPSALLSGSPAGPYGMMGRFSFSAEMFPPPNRYFPTDRAGLLEPMFQQLKARDMMPAMYAALDQEEKELTDWRANYPALMRIYFQWWDDKRDAAIVAVRALLARDPSDDYRLLLAAMLTQQQQYDAAIDVLGTVSARYGPDYIRAQKQLLHTARLARKNDMGHAAALRLLALRLPRPDLMEIADDLRNVGLADKADAILAPQSRGAGPVANPGTAPNSQLMRSVQEAIDQKNETVALDLAHQILQHDPLSPTQAPDENYLRIEALSALREFHQLDVYAQDLKQQLTATPDSIRLNWLAGEAFAAMPDTATQTGIASSLPYYQRVAELSPRNPVLLTALAERFRQAGQPGAAADIYQALLKVDFNGVMNQPTNVVQAFADAGRLPELAQIVEDWSPPPFNPTGNGQDIYAILLQVANQLRDELHLPEAERVYRKALTLDTFQSKQDAVGALVQLLLNENRRDEAAVEVEKWMLDPGAPSAARPSLLGLNVQVQNQNRNTWFQSLSWDPNGRIAVPILHFLELTQELGLSNRLRQELKTEAAQDVPSPDGQIDPALMASLLLSIISRDPTYRAELDDLLKEYPIAPGSGANSNALLILVQELETWPQQRAVAIRLLSDIYGASGGASNNSYFHNLIGLHLVRFSLDSGDHKTALKTLRSLDATLRGQRAIDPTQVQLTQALIIVRAMIREGLYSEAAQLLSDEKTDPQFVAGNAYFQQKIDQAEKELAFARGTNGPVALVYGLIQGEEVSGGKDSGTEIFWQINAGENTPMVMPYFSHTAWLEGIPLRKTSYRLEIMGGPDRRQLVTPIATFTHVATLGHAAIRLPSGVRVLQAKLISESQTPAATVIAPAAISHLLLIGAPKNLLVNPGFQISADASGQPVIVGWRGLLPATVSPKKGGPLPGGFYQSLETSGDPFAGGAAEITSDRIILQPGVDYVFGGWMRVSGGLQFHFLDAGGHLLNAGDTGSGGDDSAMHWRSWLLVGHPQTTDSGGIPIPPKTAFLEIVFKLNQESDFAGLSLRVWADGPPR